MYTKESRIERYVGYVTPNQYNILIFSEYASIKSSNVTTIEVENVESLESKPDKTNLTTSEIKVENQETSRSDLKLEQSVEMNQERITMSTALDSTHTSKDQTSKNKENFSKSLHISRETREKSAEDKLEELDTKLKFVKMIRGTNVECKYMFSKLIMWSRYLKLQHLLFISHNTLIMCILHIFKVLVI